MGILKLTGGVPAIVASCGGPREGLIWGGSSSAWLLLPLLLLLLLLPPDGLLSLLRLKNRKAAAATATASALEVSARQRGGSGLASKPVHYSPEWICAL